VRRRPSRPNALNREWSAGETEISVDPSIVEPMFDIDEMAAVDPHANEAALIEQIAWLERVKSAAAAGQARAAAALDEKRRADEAAAGVPKAKQGRGVASEVALARRDSPARGGRHLGLAKALVHEMPHTLAALGCGALSEWRATLIARESACRTLRTGDGWMANCAPTSTSWMVWGMRGSPRRRRRSPPDWMRRRWWIGRRKLRRTAP
jgi:hypothetical protein